MSYQGCKSIRDGGCIPPINLCSVCSHPSDKNMLYSSKISIYSRDSALDLSYHPSNYYTCTISLLLLLYPEVYSQTLAQLHILWLYVGRIVYRACYLCPVTYFPVIPVTSYTSYQLYRLPVISVASYTNYQLYLLPDIQLQYTSYELYQLRVIPVTSYTSFELYQ